MNRVHAASSTALLAGLGSLLWLAASASIAADAAKSDDSEASRASRQQRLDAAQRRLERAAQEVAELSMSLSEEEVAAATPRARQQRAVLGVNIGSDEDDDRGEGVEVLSVSPGGGAAEAGLKSGDVLLAINNKVLRRDEEGSARAKLLGALRSVKPGDKVTVKYRRDSRARSVDVATKPISDRVVISPRIGKLERFEIPSIAFSRAGGILGNAELVPLNPKLGQYFGTDKGLLVVRAPSDDNLELEEGDVILEIDGRAPTSTSHAMRILSSYQPGEKLTLNVMRRKRRNNIEFVVPESAPRAGVERNIERHIERHIERSLRNLPAAQQQLRRSNIRVTPPPPAPPAPPIAALDPLPPLPPVAPLTPRPAAALRAPVAPAIEIQPLPDVEVEVETIQ
jgi:S1-C subfamily serine protease